MVPTRTRGPLILSISRSYEPVDVFATPQKVRPSSAHIIVGSAGTEPTDLPSASYTLSVASDVLGRRQRRRPSGDGITLSRLRLLIWVPVQSSPCRSFEGPRHECARRPSSPPGCSAGRGGP